MSSIFNSRKIFYKELLVLLLLLLLLMCPSKSQPIAVDGDKVSNIKVELATDGQDGLHKVKSWYNVQVGLDVRLICNVGIKLTTDTSNDDLQVEHNTSWRFVSDLEHRKSNKKNWTIHLPKDNKSRCKFTRHYQADRKRSQEAEIECSSDMILPNLHLNQSGYYNCQSNLLVFKMGDFLVNSDFSSEVLINVRKKEMSTLVITTIVLIIIGLFIVVVVSFKFSGHHFTWEKSRHDVSGIQMSRISSYDTDFAMRERHWHQRPRSNSSASAMSGIVFQANPESMARLMERLQKVDNDPSPTDSVTTTSNQPQQNVTVYSDSSNRDRANEGSSKNQTKENSKTPTYEMSPKTFETKQTNGLVRKSSGSLKLEKRSKPKPVPLHRHSSLGILPSTIAIGSGFYLDDLYDEEICRAKRDQVGRGHNMHQHSGPGILGPIQSKSCSNTPHTLRSEIFLHRQGSGHTTPTRGRVHHLDDLRRTSLHPRASHRGFRDVSISSGRSRLNSDDETILEEEKTEEVEEKQVNTI